MGKSGVGGMAARRYGKRMALAADRHIRYLFNGEPGERWKRLDVGDGARHRGISHALRSGIR